MSQSQAAPAPLAAPAPDPTARHQLPAPGAFTAQRARPSLRGGTTPERYRRWSLLAAGACVVAAVVASIAVQGHADATNRIERNTGPVLVTTQTLLSSLAEADSAATAAFLSGQDEDPNARRAHLDARARATAQLEDISALIGDDPAAHEALKDVTETLTNYVGLVEAARATNLAGLAVGEAYLTQAVETLAGDLTQGAARLSEASTARLERDADRLSLRAAVAVAALFAALALLVWQQFRLSRLSRRLLNLPLVAATVALLVAGVWSLFGLQSSQRAFEDARVGAFSAITDAASIQTSAFAANDAQTLALITGSPVATQADDDLASRLRELAADADSDREQARVDEASLRWERYRAARQRLRAAGEQNVVSAFDDMTREFNGFSFTMEAVLADNTDQFAEGLATTNARTRGLPTAVLVLPLLAALLALAGFQLRINEYR